MRSVLFAGVFAFSPLAALAQSCESNTPPTCAEGTVYDEETKACVQITS